MESDINRNALQDPGSGLLSLVRDLIQARRGRIDLFGSDLFAEPAWDLLLEAFAWELEAKRGSISNLIDTANIPATTGLRWIEKLEAGGWLVREDDQNDARKVSIRVTKRAKSVFTQYFKKYCASALKHGLR